jgi:TolB protein
MQKVLIVLSAVLFASCSTSSSNLGKGDAGLSFPNEKRISNLRQLTFTGTNAEAYWAFDGKSLSFQHSGEDAICDQIYTMGIDGKNRKRVSNGEGRTTCGFYTPDDNRIIYSSTHVDNKRCPPEPDKSQGYVWPIYPTYQFYSVKADATDVKPMEPGAPSAYNAEMTVCKDGKVVFTSDRNGDLDLYTGKIDGQGFLVDVKQVTHDLGYDGGAFFSQDCSKLVWRASRPKPGKETEEYVSLLRKHLVKPGALEIWMADADGTHSQQVTKLDGASFAPYFVPGNDRILFSSNFKNPRGRNFDIYMIKTNGTELEQITFSKSFDSFPMFSPDGKYLAFSSNRNARKPRETNVFIANWNGRGPGPLITDQDSDPANRYYSIVKELASLSSKDAASGRLAWNVPKLTSSISFKDWA